MTPLISMQLRNSRRVFWPGDQLECRYQIDAVDPTELQAVEASVLWYSEGKGEEDLAVHAFQRRVAADVPEGDLRRLETIETVLPNSPLSYGGVILKIRWCVRVRVFWGHGRNLSAELAFQLGDVPEPTPLPSPDDATPTISTDQSPTTGTAGTPRPTSGARGDGG